MYVLLKIMARQYVLAALLYMLATNPAAAEAKRVALVIGNTAYDHARPLPNARPDAKAMAVAFEAIGFAVTPAFDLDYAGMREAIRAFGRAAGQAEMAVVYFAGHGLETRGRNWLVPTSAELKQAAELEYEAVSLDSIVQAVKGAQRLRLIILDACRNDPLGASDGDATRSGGTRGLAIIEPAGDILIAYSAKHGTVAEDGPPGGHSPFASAMMAHLATPGLDVRILMGRVRDTVVKATNKRQEPFTYGSIGGETLPLVDPPKGAAVATSDTTNAITPDELAWMRSVASNRLDDYRGYLAQFPDGKFASEARAKIDRLAALLARWIGLSASRSRKLLEAFVVDAENTEFSRLAKQRLSDVALGEKTAWEKAEDEKRTAIYEQFLIDWPDGYLSDNARERLAELADIRAKWDKLKGSDNQADLEAFVRLYGWSDYGAAAAERLVALRRENKTPSDDLTKVLSAAEMTKALDGARLMFTGSGASISFSSAGKPAYRTALGNDFLKKC